MRAGSRPDTVVALAQLNGRITARLSAQEVFVPLFMIWSAAPSRPASPARHLVAPRPTLNEHSPRTTQGGPITGSRVAQPCMSELPVETKPARLKVGVQP